MRQLSIATAIALSMGAIDRSIFGRSSPFQPRSVVRASGGGKALPKLKSRFQKAMLAEVQSRLQPKLKPRRAPKLRADRWPSFMSEPKFPYASKKATRQLKSIMKARA